MKPFVLSIFLLLGFLGGCQSTPPAIPGTSVLRVDVIAEPKTGARIDTGTSDSYGGGAFPGGGAFEQIDYAALDSIVIYLQPMNVSSSSAPPATVTVNVDSTKPAKGITAVVSVGQTISFNNTGAIPVHLYCVSDGNNFSHPTQPAQASSQYCVKSPGLLEILTDSLEDPLATIYAAPAPWARLTQAGQTIEFRDVPPGQYRIVSWHPRLPGHETIITLTPDQTTHATVKVTVNGLPSASSR